VSRDCGGARREGEKLRKVAKRKFWWGGREMLLRLEVMGSLVE